MPFLWGLYEGISDTYFQFEKVTELVQWFQDLERDHGRQTFYAHNGGKFDYHFFRDQINSDENILIINGRLAKFKVGCHEFRDSLSIFPNTRLKDFGIKSDIDYAKMEISVRHIHMAEIGAYLKQDCVGLWRVIARYRKEHGKQLTQAGASMRAWSKMSGREPPRQTRGEHLALKKYYYGGRVQCFESGVKKTDFEVYDINSAYPFAMRNLHPISTIPSVSDQLPKTDLKIGPCLISLSCTSKNGALPYRQESELFFPEDERTEESRKKGDIAGRIFGKYFMNSLYGKFGANCENYAEYVIASIDTEDIWRNGGKLINKNIDGGYIEYKDWGTRKLMVRNPTEEELDDIQGKWRYYNIATAASVTGFVRAYLYRALCKSSGAIYCDTDSIKARGFSNIETGSELGKWKREYVGDYFAVAGKKLYADHIAGRPWDYDPKEESESKKNWKIASKGANIGRLKEAPKIIENIANGESYRYNPDVPTFSFWRDQPVFVPRDLRATAKNMAIVPNV